MSTAGSVVLRLLLRLLHTFCLQQVHPLGTSSRLFLIVITCCSAQGTFDTAQLENVEVTDVSMTEVTSDASMTGVHSASCASDQTHVCGAVAQMAADAPGVSEAHSPNNSSQRWAVS